jgi:hypothetical protein
VNALKALKPAPRWLKVTGTATSAFSGLLSVFWWYGAVTPFPVIVVSFSAFAMMCLEIYTLRRRPDADGNEQNLPSEILPIHPPGIAEVLITLIVPDGRSEPLLGDFEERFHRHVETRGLKMAKALYWAEVLRSILPILVAKAKKLGVIAVIAELWRRSHL